MPANSSKNLSFRTGGSGRWEGTGTAWWYSTPSTSSGQSCTPPSSSSAHFFHLFLPPPSPLPLLPFPEVLGHCAFGCLQEKADKRGPDHLCKVPGNCSLPLLQTCNKFPLHPHCAKRVRLLLWHRVSLTSSCCHHRPSNWRPRLPKKTIKKRPPVAATCLLRLSLDAFSLQPWTCQGQVDCPWTATPCRGSPELALEWWPSKPDPKSSASLPWQ